MKKQATGSHGARGGAAPVGPGVRRLKSVGICSGFTLAELLIAMVIFLTVAGGIALLFSQSIRTVKVGHQNIDISEHIRAAMDLVETDLTQAFTSRDYGDYYTFYGTPIGMTFVGLVRPNRDASQPNLSRVTYVIYGIPNRFTSLETYAESAPDNQPLTYALLRYVEPNQDTLDDFMISPVPLANGRYESSSPWPDPFGTAPPEGQYRNLYWELWEAANCFSQGTFDISRCDNAGGRFLCEEIRPGVADPACVNEIIRAKKRELWIRMLAGDRNLPPFWAEDGNTGGPTYKDFVLAENIVLVQDVAPGQQLFKENILTLAANDPNQLNPAVQPWPDRAGSGSGFNPFRPIFTFGVCCVNGQPQFYPFWTDYRNMFGLNPDIPEGVVNPTGPSTFGSPMAPRVPMVVDLQLNFLMKTPYAGAPDLFRGFVKQIDVPTGYTRGDLTG